MQCVIWQEGARSRALGMMCRMMASWMQGSVRECFLNMRQGKQAHDEAARRRLAGERTARMLTEGNDEAAQKQALSMRMLSRMMSAWMQGSLRGCFFNMRQRQHESVNGRESESLIEELQAASIAYREESIAAHAELQTRLGAMQVHCVVNACSDWHACAGCGCCCCNEVEHARH